MDIKIKTAVIIISTLLIGIIVGFMGSRIVMKQRMKFMTEEPMPARLHKSLMRIIRPTEQQRESIEPLLNSYTEKFNLINHDHRFEMESLIDSLFVDLLPLLNEKQQQRLTKRKERMEGKQKEMWRRQKQRLKGERRHERPGP